MRIHGGCLCGAITYEIDEPPAVAVHCHCSICRRVHGASFGTFAVVSNSKFRWTQGAEKLREYESGPGNLRQFCPRCGSQITVVEGWNPDGVTICMGSFYDDPKIRPSAHMYAGSKAPWWEIADDLPQSDEWPEGVGPNADSAQADG